MRPDAVGLEIVLVDDIDAVFVGQLEEQGVRRIVGGADRVYVVFLAEADVALDLLRGQTEAVARMRVVVVDAVELDLPVIEQETVLVNLGDPEADTLPDAAGRRFIVQIVEDGRFRGPFLHGQIFKAAGGAAAPGRDRDAAPDPVTGERKGDLRLRVGQGRYFQKIEILSLVCSGVDVGNVGRVGDVQEHVPENTVVPEHILALQIAAVAPAVHDGQKLVLSLAEPAGEVELGGVVRALGIADEGSVEIEIQTARHAEEGDHEMLAGILHAQHLPIDADEVVFLARILPPRGDALVSADPAEHPADFFRGRYLRGIIGELIADVQIKGAVVTAHLPAGGHVDFVKGNRVGVQDVRKLGGTGVEFEIPVAVQTDHLFRTVALFQHRYGVCRSPVRIGDEIAAPRQLVHLEDVEVVVIGRVQGVFHRRLPLFSFGCFYYIGFCGNVNDPGKKRSVRELAVVELRVKAAGCEQALMVSDLHDLSVAHDQDHVRFADRAQTVGHDEARPPLHHRRKGILDLQLGASVDG